MLNALFSVLAFAALVTGVLACRGGSETEEDGPNAVEALAFIHDGDIWLINANGSDERQLTDLGDVQSFDWVSATELDMVTGEDGSGHILAELDGDVQILRFPGETETGWLGAAARGSWSRDGTRFVVPLDQQLVVFNRLGAEVSRVRVGPSCSAPDSLVFGPPVFAPDGRRVLVAVECSGNGGGYQLFAAIHEASLGSGTSRPLGKPGGLKGDTEGLVTNFRLRQRLLAPRFSPDGARVAQLDSGGASFCPYGTGLYVTNPDGANQYALNFAHESGPSGGDTRGGVIDYGWSPAGDKIVASIDLRTCDVSGSEDQPIAVGLYTANIDGTSGEKLVDGPSVSSAWSPSGRFIAYGAGSVSSTEQIEEQPLRLFDLDARRIVDLTRGSSPAWQPRP